MLSTLSGIGTWTPRRLPGLVAWFNATRNDVVLNATDEVTTWNATGGQSVTSTGADDPAWLPNGWGQGVGGLNMTNGTSAITSTAAGLVNPGSGTDVPFSLFCSIKSSGVVAEPTIVCWQDSVGNSLSSLRMNVVGAIAVAQYRRTDATSSNVDVTGTVEIGLGRRRIGVLFSGTSVDIYLDRNLEASGASNVGALTPDTFKIASGPGVDGFSGIFADLVVMNRLVSVADYMAYEAWSRKVLGT